MAEVNKDDLTKPASSLTQIKPREAIANTQNVPSKPKAREAEKEETFGDRIVRNARNINYKQMGDDLLYDWLFPEVISKLGDILRAIFSKDGKVRAGGSKKRGNYTAYNSIYDEKYGYRERRDPTRQDFRKIRLEFWKREDAVQVLDDLRERLEGSNVDYVTVRELYSLADLPTNSTMLKWGWYDLEDCGIERLGDNFVLRMPPAEVINR